MSAPLNAYRLPSGRIATVPQAGEEKSDPQEPRTVKDTTPQQSPVALQPAQGGRQGRQQPEMGGQCLQMLPMLLLFGALMYFLMIRPQQKQEKARRAMLGALSKGDQIVTTGGIHGHVAALDENTVTIKFGSGEGMRMKLDRTAVGRVVPKGGEQKEE